MPTDQTYTPALQDALYRRRQVELEEGALVHEEEVLAPFEMCGVDELDGPCLRSG